MVSNNAMRFVGAYNQIDACLRRMCDAGEKVGFGDVVRRAATKETWLEEYKEDLVAFARLRNSIVHGFKGDGSYLADPFAEVVARVEELVDRICSPPRVVPKYQKEVASLNIHDSVAAPLALIRERNYSQFPVRDDSSKFVGLLTERAVGRWAAQCADCEGSLDMDTDVGELLQFAEQQQDTCALVPENATVHDATRQFAKNPHLEAILITRNGNVSEEFLGIITAWDIMSL